MKIQIGDKIVEAEMKDGVPIIKAFTEEIKHPDGRQDVIIHIPCMELNVKGGD